MAKIRTLKAEFFRHEEISSGGLVAKTLAAGLICCVADDDGRFKASVTHLQAEIFTHDRIKLSVIEKALRHLEAVGFLCLYGDGKFGEISQWSTHQRVPPTRYEPSKLPPHPEQARRKHDASTTQADASSLGKHAATGIGGNGSEGMEGTASASTADYENGKATPEIKRGFKRLVESLRS